MRARTGVLFAALAATAVRAFLAVRHFGFHTGDDLEILEAAMRRAGLWTFTPWDVRSLLIPDLLVAPWVKAFALAGVHDRFVLALIARAPFVLLAGLNIVLVFVLGRRWFDERTAAIAATLYAAHWMPSVFGSSLYPRTVAVTCILLAAILLTGEERFDRACFAGMLAALAITTRYSEAIYLASLLILVWSSRRRLAGLVTGFALGVALFVGVYDWITWGRPFGSLLAFGELTFVRRDASSRIVSLPPWWYLETIPHWLPLTALPLIFVRTDWRRVSAFVFLPLLLLSAVFHKELRYLQVVIPFALLLAARGFTLWPWRRAIAVVLLVLAFPLAAGRIGGVAKRSTNAVIAARWMGAQHARVVAMSQAWAYGGGLFLADGTALADLPPAPTAVDLARVPHDANFVALFKTDVTNESADALQQAGFHAVREFGERGGRAVVVYAKSR